MGQHNTPSPGHLPRHIPLFPLRDALLLPGGELPLNIFEPRYLAMTQAALQSDRLIGMIQPKNRAGDLYTIGCAGRIISFHETDDARYLITLRGQCRFRLNQHHLTSDNFYLADVTWLDEDHRIAPDDFIPPAVCRHTFKKLVDVFLARENLSITWDEAALLPEGKFYTLLSMLAPFSVTEKQALLEAHDLNARCNLLLRLLDIATAESKKETDDKSAYLH